LYRAHNASQTHKRVQEINAQLGKVISEKPTEEMYETVLTDNVTVEDSEGISDNGGNW